VRMALAGLVGVAVLLVCGCGSSAHGVTEQQPTGSDGGGVATKPSSSNPVASATTRPAQELLTRPTARPPHVSAQFEFIGGAGPGACLEMGNPPQVRVLVEPFPGKSEGFNEKGIATFGQPVDVCFDGMGSGPISVTVSGPNGFEMSGELPRLPSTPEYHSEDEWTSFDWVPAIEPSWPQGRYLITARTSEISRSHALILVPPSGPGLRVLGPSTDPGHNSVPSNSQAKLYLTGFKGNSTVELTAYRMAESFGLPAHFFGVASVPIPPSGNTVIEIPTGPGKGRSGPTFIITTHYQGRTLFAPFTVFKERKWANQTVGALQGS
jgi:hypothetical protein